MVLEHTDLFNHPTYSQLVRLLFNFMTSQVRVKIIGFLLDIIFCVLQVATIWVLPVVFLHSCKLNKIKKKQKLHRDVDLLTPMMALMVMVFRNEFINRMFQYRPNCQALNHATCVTEQLSYLNGYES